MREGCVMKSSLQAIAAKRNVVTGNARSAMPKCAEWIDEIREVFGNPVGINAEESGKFRQWGKKMDGVEFKARVWPVKA